MPKASWRAGDAQRAAERKNEGYAFWCTIRPLSMLCFMSDDATSFVRGLIVESGRRFRASRGALLSAQDEGRRAVARGVREAGGYGVPSALVPDDTTTITDHDG